MRSLLLLIIMLMVLPAVSDQGIRLKEIGRFEGIRENEVIGYGMVVGLAGTGDSARNKATIQSIANTLISFGVNVDIKDIRSRNVAAVMVTAKLPPFSEKGDRVDVKVSSLGDARSLAGGTLFLTPLKAANDVIYMLAQGQVSVGGFAFDSFDSVVQKNHPTVGIVANGGLIEKNTNDHFLINDNTLNFLLSEPDFRTMEEIMEALERSFPDLIVEPKHAGKLKITLPSGDKKAAFKQISAIERLVVKPDIEARVVINERTGTIIAGGNVRLSSVTISHGGLRLNIDTQYGVSQPFFIGRAGDSVASTVIPQTKIEVKESSAQAVNVANGANVADLIEALKKINVSTRDIIVILQSIKKAGALHAELIVE
ncbi:flagellar basal body P-ring protein FlgI [Pleionea sp. CnH1-48]|uniref:flagellar basal body P-ring protein FlgI n=1 Tax=Pleionea sp. CnH1-48 TaxID=2954494 RepID=UPI0020984D23|nr:flagellar basal body P-ring protein FlgI [Pleionea sp. CnH1-48]MCO7223717.1 flagellar basal body P-ring protein FlgI [Pleionea sp. CnH1-48]